MAAARTPHPDAAALPATYARLVADAPAASFAAAARVERLACPLEPSQLAAGEVLVRMHWAGVNGGCETFRARAEHAFSRHRTAAGKPWPLGAEGSGVVVARADEGVPPSLPLGQAVAVNGASAFCEYTVAKASFCTPVPEPSAEAAALTLSALTAAAALGPQEGGGAAAPPRVPAGGAVVVTAAAGGAGHFAVQYARLYGAGRVVAVVGSARKARWLREELWPEVLRRGRGNDEAAAGGGGGEERAAPPQPLTDELVVVDASEFLPPRSATSPSSSSASEEGERALAEALRRACGGKGADLVFEGVGGGVGRACLAALSPRGGFALQVGYISEYPHNDGLGGGGGGNGADGSSLASTSSSSPNAELFWQGLERDLGEGRRVTGKVWPRDPKAIARAKRRVFADFYDRGVLVAHVHAPEGLRGVEDVPEAVERMLKGEHVGKFVVPLV